ncbi:RPS21 [Branchiostoma lanceolatum]|uniref:Small ribosomal subunit protein eS21 n=1 Tax=Branchiostoma lanceolatum TaxID=7740 RepID=A0A8K0ENE7_BRALA|nr:RPS21 [Branchiostoma lanceolatum]
MSDYTGNERMPSVPPLSLSAIFGKHIELYKPIENRQPSCRTTQVKLWICTSPASGDSSTNRIIGAKDHASIQINFAEVDPTTGRMTGQYKTYAICGYIRQMGESDDCLKRLAIKDKIIDG